MAIRAEDQTTTTEETTILVTIEPGDTRRLFTEPGALDPLVAAIRERVSGFVPVTATKAGRDEIAALAYKVARTKTFIDEAGKKFNAELKELPKKVDQNRKTVWDALEAIQTEVRRPLTIWEQRRAQMKADIEGFQAIPATFLEMDAQGWEKLLEARRAVVIGPEWEDMAEGASEVLDRSINAIIGKLEQRRGYDAEQVELAVLRQQQAEREEKERHERMKRDAEERIAAKVQADMEAAKEAQARAEREKAAAEEQRKLAEERAARAEAEAKERAEQAAAQAAAAERERHAREAAALEAETQRRANHARHRERVEREVNEALIEVLKFRAATEQEAFGYAEDLLAALKASKIPHLSIGY